MTVFLSELWMILRESALWLIVGFAIAGIVHALVPREWMLRHLSGRGIAPVVKASLLGIPLPLCSCSVIPVAAGLRRQGASKGASAAFAISTPQTGEESIPITWALFGPVYAFARPVVAVLTGLIAGLLIDLTSTPDNPAPNPEPGTGLPSDPGAIPFSITNADEAAQAVERVDAAAAPPAAGCCSTPPPPPPPPPTQGGSCCQSQPASSSSSSCCSSEPAPPPSSCCANKPTRGPSKARVALTHGFRTMPVDLALWLAIGLLLAALIGAFVPESFFTQHAGDGMLPKLAMLLVGIPLYICATSSTPLAWTLVAAGLSPGAALVLLLSGPATNPATMSWVIKDLGLRALAIYLGVIAVLALSAGILFDAALARFVHIADSAHLHDHAGPLGVKDIGATLFVLLMAWWLGLKARDWMNQRGWGTTKAASKGCCAADTPAGGCCSSTGGREA